METPRNYPHNIHHKLIGTTVNDGQFGHSHWENDMVHNCTLGPSIFDHLGLPTITLLKVELYAHIK